MRKTLLAAIIAATALVPPAALAQDRGGRGSNRERVQNENSGGAPVRENRGSWRAENSGGGGQARPQRNWGGNGGAEARPQRNWGGNGGGEARPQRNWGGGSTPQVQPRPQAQPQVQPQPQTQPPRQWRGGNDGNRGQWRDRTPGEQPRATPPQQRRDWDNNRGNRDGRWNDNNRRGDNRWNDNRRGDNRWNNNRGWNDNRGWNGRNDRGRWNNNWRNNNRYDWRGFRNGNRSHFRLPRYYAPSGWGYGYSRFGIGYTLNSLLFSSQYWINDPYSYRLPEVYGPYRWVRYYNDALLVDIYTGEVVDAIYDIFW